MKNKYLKHIYYFMCMNVLHESMCTTHRQVPQRPEGMELPETKVKGSCELPDGTGN